MLREVYLDYSDSFVNLGVSGNYKQYKRQQKEKRGS